MLCDNIAVFAGSQFDQQMHGAVTGVSGAIQKAQRFILSPETRMAADILAKSKPSSLLSVIPSCRIPFQTMWMEWEAPQTAERDPDPEGLVLHDYKRFGALIECLDDTHMKFGVSFCWSFHEGDLPRNAVPINISVLGYIVNWNDGWPLNISDHFGFVQPKFEHSWCGHHKATPEELVAFDKLRRMTIPTHSPYTADLFESFMRERGLTDAKKLLYAGANDIKGEMQTIIACLCLLNSKNCIDIIHKDFAVENKARRKKGKKPRMSYSEIEISLSKRDAKVAKESQMTHAEIRKHIVRGHFKIRRGGVYWWRPFIRGKAIYGEVKRTGYKVTGVPDVMESLVREPEVING